MTGPVTVTNFLVAGATVTRPTARLLPIVWHHQAHNLSCEAAALKMALAYTGVNLDELTLMSYMGYDLRPARFDAKGRLITWGDPNAAYVGNPDGHIERYTGYGVYYAPVARAVVAAGIQRRRRGVRAVRLRGEPEHRVRRGPGRPPGCRLDQQHVPACSASVVRRPTTAAASLTRSPSTP